MTKTPGLANAYRGQVIDTAAKNAIARDPEIKGLYVTRSGEYRPDIHDSMMNTWWDITTPGQWTAHVAQYGGLYGYGIPLYTVP